MFCIVRLTKLGKPWPHNGGSVLVENWRYCFFPLIFTLDLCSLTVHYLRTQGRILHKAVNSRGLLLRCQRPITSRYCKTSRQQRWTWLSVLDAFHATVKAQKCIQTHLKGCCKRSHLPAAPHFQLSCHSWLGVCLHTHKHNMVLMEKLNTLKIYVNVHNSRRSL